MLCPYCGRDVEDATVCPYCNEPLQTAPAQTENDQPEAKEPAKNIFAILSLILAILGQSLPAWVLGTVGLAFAETKYEGRGKAMSITSIFLGIFLPQVYSALFSLLFVGAYFLVYFFIFAAAMSGMMI